MQEPGPQVAREDETADLANPDEPDVADENEDPEDLDQIDEGDLQWPKAQQSQPILDESAEREELARFREEWKAEVRSKQAISTSADRGLTAQTITIHRASSSTAPEVARPKPAEPAPTSPVLPLPVAPTVLTSSLATSTDPATLPLPLKLRRALEVYEQAVRHEQRGELDEALRLYRQAFRFDENVSRVYERMEYHAQLRAEKLRKPTAAHSDDLSVPSHSRSNDGDDVVRGMARITLDKLPAVHGVATGTLASLIATWPSSLSFEPEEEKEPTHIQVLPDELLVHMLHYLDVTALERFGTVNKKARLLTLDITLWRTRVEAIYTPPQIGDDDSVASLLSQYLQDYRRMYIEHPRVRIDGVYIAVCHYIRDGLSENAWNNVSHLITYHRYLRFLPNGDVLSLLTNEESKPQAIIPMLNSTLRMKGFYIGQWRLEGTTVYITNLMDPSGAMLRYTFQMILDLRSRPLGRWNKLDFRAYDSVSLESGEATPLALKNDRPYWFSKVRSYA